MTAAHHPNLPVRVDVPRWWRRSMGLVVSTLTAAACVVVLWAALAPVIDVVPAIIAGWWLVTVAAAWIALATIGWFRFRTCRLSLIAPMMVVVTAALVLTSAPFWIGFQLSRSSLETAAQACAPSGGDGRAGVYAVTSVTRVGNTGCRFATRGGLLQSVGLAHLPDGVPADSIHPDTGGIKYEHLTGDWFRYQRDF